jgi:hypothetical protein
VYATVLREPLPTSSRRHLPPQGADNSSTLDELLKSIRTGLGKVRLAVCRDVHENTPEVEERINQDLLLTDPI